MKFSRLDGKTDKVILSAWILRIPDDSPDTSCLGEYSNDPGPYAIDRFPEGDVNWREYRYFNPCHENYKGLSVRTIKKYCKQDFERMEALRRGDWFYIGIRAEAKFTINGIIQSVSSGGLWGIESDSGEDWIKETEREEHNDLKDIVDKLGVTGLPNFEDIERRDC